MKKTLINIALGGSIMASIAFVNAPVANAQNIDLSQFRALVQLLIAIGAIPADKADIARNFVGITEKTPVVAASSTPIFISGSNVQSNGSSSEPVLGVVEEITPTTTASFVKSYVDPIPFDHNGIPRGKVDFAFNDASSIELSVYCPQADNSVRSRVIKINKSDIPKNWAPGTYSISYIGVCTYSVKSYDSHGSQFGNRETGTLNP